MPEARPPPKALAPSVQPGPFGNKDCSEGSRIYDPGMKEVLVSPTPDRRLGNYRNAELAELRHSLRTPLREVLSGAEILIEEASMLHNDRALDLLRHIHSAGLAALNDVNLALSNRESVEQGETELLFAKIRPRVDRVLLSLEGLDRSLGIPEDWVEDVARISENARGLFRMLEGAPADWPLEEPAPEKHATEAAGPRVLLAGGEAMERRVLSRRLERQGYTAVDAGEVSQALDAVAAEPFDIVLLDLLAPAAPKFELLERIKADRRLREIPIIAMAGLDETDRAVRALQLGAADYLLKPFEPALLRLRINLHLELRRLRKQLSEDGAGAERERVGSVTRIAELASFLVREQCRKAEHLGIPTRDIEQLREVAAHLEQSVARLRG
jgi:DNA-binding response OmpR family regulator